MNAPYYNGRRRRTLRPWAVYTACVVGGLAIGLGGSYLKPGPWWGPRNAFNPPERDPRVGDVICVDGTCVYLQAVLEVPDDRRVVAVRWLRGKVGAEALRVTDCTAGAGVVTALDGGERRRWSRDGRTITDHIAVAACGPPPPPRA